MVTRRFTAASDSVDFGAVSTFNGLTRLSVRIVFGLNQAKVTAFGEGELSRTLVSIWTPSSGGQGFLLGQDPGDPLGTVRFTVGDAAGNTATVASGPPWGQSTPLTTIWRQPDAFWHELVAVWTASAFTVTTPLQSYPAGYLALYLDGLKVGEAIGQTAVTAIGSPTGHLCIGASPGGYNSPVAMAVRHVGFWADVLDEDRIFQMAQSHTPASAWNSNPTTLYLGGTRRGSFVGELLWAPQAGGSEVLVAGNIPGSGPAASVLATATVTGTARDESEYPIV